MKTVIQTWCQKCKNLPGDTVNNFWGLGDIIRGTIALYQLSKKMNFRFIVDIQLHPLSNFLKVQTHEYEDLIQSNKDNILFINNSEKFITMNTNDVIFFLTNDQCEINLIDDDCRDFIKKILQPSHQLSLVLNENINKLPQNYNILHYRLGDGYLVRNKNNQNLQILFENIRKHYETSDVFMTDGILFKDFIKAQNVKDLIILDTKVCHLGFHNNVEEVKDTIIEFFLITKSKKIKTHSVYGWVSGFVKWASVIYKIPLIQI